MAKSLSSVGHKTAKTAGSIGRNVRLGDAKAKFEIASGAKSTGARFEVASGPGQGPASVKGGNGMKFQASKGSLNVGKQSQSNAKFEVAK